MKKSLDWSCSKCSGLNEPTSPVCWNCQTSLIDQKQAAAVVDQELMKEALIVQEGIAERRIALEQATVEGRATIADLLRACVGERIGINADNPSETDTALVIGVQQDFFTVQIKDFLYHLPYTAVLRVIAAGDGSSLKGALNHYSHRVIVKVFDLVIYKNSMSFGVGVSVPI